MKIRSQLDIKRKMGDFIGSFCTYGYRKSEKNKNKLLIDEEAARIVEMIFRLRLQGLSNSRIADRLNGMGVLSPMEYKQSKGMNYRSGFRANERGLWNAVSVQRILTNEVYIGTLIVYGFYSKDLSQKIKTVLKAKAQKGQYIGSYAPYGFLKDPKDKHHLIPDPVAARIVKRIFSLALEMKTTGEIARILNDDHVETPAAHFKRLYPESKKFQKTTTAYNSWTCMNVYDILQRQEYTGAVVSQKKKYKGIEQTRTLSRDKKDWIIVPDCHEALVSKESFEAAQEAILRCGTYERKTGSYLLRSLVRCGCCDRTMSRVRKGRNVGSFYKCDKNRYIENSPCPMRR